MYDGEIFALLGHNGAGKTTTINMITGLLMPSKGEAYYKNINLFSQMQKIRTTLGVCPQLDVLFDDITVQEHLELFYIFKNPKNNFLITNPEEYDMNTEIEK